MYTDTDYLVWRERYQNLQREAAHERLILTLWVAKSSRLNPIQQLTHWLNQLKTIAFSAPSTEAPGETIVHL